MGHTTPADEESLRLLQVSTLLLQRCAAAGLTLAEIATVATRPLIGLDEEPSELERICYAARLEADEAGTLTDLEEEDCEGEECEEDEGRGDGGESEPGPRAGAPAAQRSLPPPPAPLC